MDADSTFIRGPLSIRFITGQIVAHDRAVFLPDKECQLLFSVAAAERAINVEKLIDPIWPTADGDAAHNSFRVCLYRLRKHLNAGEVIRRQGNACFLCDDVDVDLRALRHTLARSPPSIAELHGFYIAITEGLPARASLGDWFYPFEDLLRSYRQRCGHLLATAALETHDRRRAIMYAREVLAREPNDVRALEILLKCNAAVTVQ